MPHCKCMEPFTVVICRISCRTLSSWRRLLCAYYWRRPFTNFPNTTSVPSTGWAFVCLSFSLHQQHVNRCSFCTAVWGEMYCQHPTDCRTNTQLTDNMLHMNINVLFCIYVSAHWCVWFYLDHVCDNAFAPQTCCFGRGSKHIGVFSSLADTVIAEECKHMTLYLHSLYKLRSFTTLLDPKTLRMQ